MGSETGRLIVIFLLCSMLLVIFFGTFPARKLDKIHKSSLKTKNHIKIKKDYAHTPLGLYFVLLGLNLLIVGFDTGTFFYHPMVTFFYISFIGLIVYGVYITTKCLGIVNAIELFKDRDYFIYRSIFLKSYEIKYSDIDYIEFYVIGEGLKRFEIIENVPVKYIKIHTKVKTFKLYIYHMIGAKYFFDKLQEYDKVKFPDLKNEEQP